MHDRKLTVCVDAPGLETLEPPLETTARVEQPSAAHDAAADDDHVTRVEVPAPQLSERAPDPGTGREIESEASQARPADNPIAALAEAEIQSPPPDAAPTSADLADGGIPDAAGPDEGPGDEEIEPEIPSDRPDDHPIIDPAEPETWPPSTPAIAAAIAAPAIEMGNPALSVDESRDPAAPARSSEPTPELDVAAPQAADWPMPEQDRSALLSEAAAEFAAGTIEAPADVPAADAVLEPRQPNWKTADSAGLSHASYNPAPAQPGNTTAAEPPSLRFPAAGPATPDAAPDKILPDAARLAVKVGRYAMIGLGVWFAAMVLLIAVFRFVDPPASALMLIRAAQGVDIDQRWVPLEKISPNLVRAVIASEDGRFCRHWGIDPREVLDAIRRSNGGTPRGASTMTMQLAKNLFLWPRQSYLRKALEMPLTLTIDALWPKSRIAEVYLNIVEWGSGIFGAEAAARRHFDRSAAKLSRRQSALLAVTLPNPLVRKPAAPSHLLSRMASTIEARVRNMSTADDCVTKLR